MLLFASIAIAENEAVYNEATGLVEIPVLSVKGQSEKYSVTLQQQEETENLTFAVTDAVPDPTSESSTNEATFDPESGAVIIPTLMVLEQGEPSVKTYSVELQQTEELIFKVSQAEPILALPTNTFNGIASETVGFSVSAKAATKRCSGSPSQNLATARQSFKTMCGETWNDQKHVCDYKPDGFHCSGNVSASKTPETTRSTTSNPVASGSSRCTGNPSQNLATARQNFKTKCGEPWNDQKHVCDYKPDGFHCSGNVSASTTPAPTNPTTSNSPATNPDWCTGTPDRNRDVAKRNFRDACGQTWNDQLGHICESKSDGWHCSGNRISSNGSELRAPRSVKATRLHPKVVAIEWETIGIHSVLYDIYRNGKKIGYLSPQRYAYDHGEYPSTFLYVDKNATGNPTYQIVAYNSRTRSPSSNVADPLNTTRARTLVSSTGSYNNLTRGVSTQETVEVDVSRDISMRSTVDISDGNGNYLGTMTQTYNGDKVTSTIDSVYGSSYEVDLDPVYAYEGLNGGGLVRAEVGLGVVNVGDVVLSEFPPKPRGTTTPGGGGECENCPPTPTQPPYVQDCPSGGGECVGP